MMMSFRHLFGRRIFKVPKWWVVPGPLARVKPRVAARVVISGGASGSAPAAWQREVELRRYLGSRVFLC